MDRSKLKTYAPQARQDFIQAMKARAALLGITDKSIAPATLQGDSAIIQGQAYPKAVEERRLRLSARIQREGFEAVMEAMAYTWFNRLAALRYMELHGYLDHGYRVLSHPEGKATPEILEHAEHVDLPGLKRERVVDLKLEGKEQELYRLLLVAQCNALHQAMPFLFEAIEDETELLLPDHLLHSDSVVRKLVSNLDAEDCENVEVLGWLYQFYIAEKKDSVMARKSAVPTEDIPAVTQLFTPHWIVRYLVENSLGRLWLLNRPSSNLKVHMPYYIEGEAETDFLRIEKLEDIRLLDPACGSGHMLTYAFDLLYLIYEEAGYAPNDIPALILKHNLHGLEICPRAAQLAGLALVLKAREKSRRFLQPERIVQPAVLELQNVRFEEGELREYIRALGLGDLFSEPLIRLLHQFEEAKTFGSLIQPCMDEQAITEVRRAIEAKNIGSQMFLRDTHQKVMRVLEQAEALTQRHQVMVANPPYMTGGMNNKLSAYVAREFKESRSDLSAVFIDRSRNFCLPNGELAMVTMHSWMFLSTLSNFRKTILTNCSITNLTHHGIGAFPSMNSKVVQTVAFVLQLRPPRPEHIPVCFRLLDYDPDTKENQLKNNEKRFDRIKQVDFSRIDGWPIAYWLSKAVIDSFQNCQIRNKYELKEGLGTRNDSHFLKCFWEVDFHKTKLHQPVGAKWIPTDKAGSARKWYGNNYYVMNWENDGYEIKNYRNDDGTLKSRPQNIQYFFREAATWGKVGTIAKTFRYRDCHLAFNDAAPSAFGNNVEYVLGLFNSIVFETLLEVQGDTMNVTLGVVGTLPYVELEAGIDHISSRSKKCIGLARADWDNFETSWDFRDLPLLRPELKSSTLAASWRAWEAHCTAALRRMQELETENNRLFIDAYGLQDELSPEVPEDQITLARAEAAKDTAALLSYAIGCMMGRYSLDKPGLVYAHAGNEGFNPSQYATFPADEDGIVPVTEFPWFLDDAALRFEAFLKTAWSPETLEENLAWVAEQHGPNKDETPRDTLRRYFATGFYKDHLQTYKKRPIYWLFSSGKERAFQALVYLHRYHEGTLARMRTEYVIPLQGRIAGRIEQLREDIARATSTAHGKKLQKELDTLRKQEVELRAFDEQLRHTADLRISLDLDDGVKKNYGKFGDLLANVKDVTGGKDEE